MSHRVFDDLSRLRPQLAAIEVAIASERERRVVDFAELADLRSARAVLLGQIAIIEAEAQAR